MVTDLSDKISRYLKGEFDYESGSLVFSCSKIEINMKCNEVMEGSFLMEEQSGRDVSGRIYSTNLLLECLVSEFEGKEINVAYRVDTADKHLLVYKVTYSSKNNHVSAKNAQNNCNKNC